MYFNPNPNPTWVNELSPAHGVADMTLYQIIDICSIVQVHQLQNTIVIVTVYICVYEHTSNRCGSVRMHTHSYVHTICCRLDIVIVTAYVCMSTLVNSVVRVHTHTHTPTYSCSEPSLHSSLPVWVWDRECTPHQAPHTRIYLHGTHNIKHKIILSGTR